VSIEFIDHTADVGVRLTASSLDALFGEAAVAFARTVTDVSDVVPRQTLHLAVDAEDLGQLLVEWLSELVGRFDIDQFLPRSASVRVRRSSSGWNLVATVDGQTIDVTRHRIRAGVKGVTYHALRVEQVASGEWQATVVFDV